VVAALRRDGRARRPSCGTNVDDVELVPDGRTFFWRGEYGWDLNSRETLDTRLNVFADFAPTACRRSTVFCSSRPARMRRSK
jgi:hypothetical protein